MAYNVKGSQPVVFRQLDASLLGSLSACVTSNQTEWNTFSVCLQNNILKHSQMVRCYVPKFQEGCQSALYVASFC